MYKVMLRLKSGREFNFECESYEVSRLNIDNSLCDFKYTGAVGECPIWFDTDNVEAIAVIHKGGEENV